MRTRRRWGRARLGGVVGGYALTVSLLYLSGLALDPTVVGVLLASLPLVVATVCFGVPGALGGTAASLSLLAPGLVGSRPLMWGLSALLVVGVAWASLGLSYIWSRRTKHMQVVRRLETSYGEEIFENSLNVIHVLDREGNVVRRNRASRELLGWPHKRSLHLTEYLHVEDIGRFKAELERLFERGEVRDVEVRFVSEGKRAVPVELQGKRVTGRVAVLEARDRTEVVSLEMQVAEGEVRYRHLIEQGIDTMDVGVLLLDRMGSLLWCNRAVGDFFGVMRDELVGMKAIRLLDHVAHVLEDGETFATMVRDAYQHGAAVEGQECRVRLGPGRQSRILMFRSIPIEPAAGQRESGGRIEYYTDITRLKKLQQELEEQKGRLEETNQKLKEFNSAVSHEVRKPALGALWHVDMMLNEYNGQLPKDVRDELERMKGRLERMRKLIEDLTHFSAIRVEKEAFERVDLDRVVNNTIEDLATDLAGVNVSMAGPLPRVWGVPTRIAELFANLLVNAVKFNDKALPAVEISWADRGDGTYEFTVQDNGPGIESQYLEKIFGIFERLEAKKEGTGAGLAFCRRIVKEHGGRIWAESELGKGTAFQFTLPKVPAEKEVERVH
ncbi:MAG: ATP-binding protein [Candidatus Bipolaricaulota bacterium]